MLENGFAAITALLAWICLIVSQTWSLAAWSQTDILLNHNPANATQFQADCPDCHMINKLTQYRAPGFWCIAVRQETYFAPAPPPPPPWWRRRAEDPYDLEPDHWELTESERSYDLVTFRYSTWNNITCVPDSWYFDTCERRETALFPDGCGPAKDNVTWVEENIVPGECTEGKYANHTVGASDSFEGIGNWGDCYYNSSDAFYESNRVEGVDYCFPAGQVNESTGAVCTCRCGERCQDKLKECPEAYTAEPRYYAAQCQAKEVTCEGTAVIYGVAISGIFFASVALIPFTASGFIRNFVLARAYMGLAMCLTGLSMLLSIAALAWWCWYIDVMNEPRQIFLEAMNRVDLLNFDMYNPKRPNFFVQYLTPNPFSWERSIKGEPYLQLDEQFEYNWGWNFLSAGWYSVLTAVCFQALALLFGCFAVRTKQVYDAPPEKFSDV